MKHISSYQAGCKLFNYVSPNLLISCFSGLTGCCVGGLSRLQLDLSKWWPLPWRQIKMQWLVEYCQSALWWGLCWLSQPRPNPRWELITMHGPGLCWGRRSKQWTSSLQPDGGICPHRLQLPHCRTIAFADTCATYMFYVGACNLLYSSLLCLYDAW